MGKDLLHSLLQRQNPAPVLFLSLLQRKHPVTVMLLLAVLLLLLLKDVLDALVELGIGHRVFFIVLKARMLPWSLVARVYARIAPDT
jgi:hypothetical protein